MRSSTSPILLILAVSLLAVPPSSALDYPLSDTSVRSAYFLGQRYKASSAEFLGPYTKYLPAPKTGPYIENVQLLTPFAQLVREYSRRVEDYSAQQAQLDHHGREDNIIFTVKILLTPTYSRILSPSEMSASNASNSQNLRPSIFWKNFEFRAFDDESKREPLYVSGKGDISRGKYGNCLLIGATVNLEFPASDFSSQRATFEVTGPDGQTVHADFDLASLR